MTTRKSSTGKAGAKKLRVKKQTLKDLDPKTGKNVKGGLPLCSKGGGGGTRGCPAEPTQYLCTAFTICVCGTAMTQCKQITCA